MYYRHINNGLSQSSNVAQPADTGLQLHLANTFSVRIFLETSSCFLHQKCSTCNRLTLANERQCSKFAAAYSQLTICIFFKGSIVISFFCELQLIGWTQVDLKETHRKEVYDQAVPLNILKQVPYRAMHEGFSSSSNLKSFYLEIGLIMIDKANTPSSHCCHAQRSC